MRILFPQDPIETKEADGPFKPELDRFRELGVTCSLFDFDDLSFGEFRPKPKWEPGEDILYRGWMMKAEMYQTFSEMVNKREGNLLISPEMYLRSHHMPGWYESLKDFTPETLFFNEEADYKTDLEKLEWDRIFVKDFVKSNYSQEGSIAHSLNEIQNIIAMIKEHRGEIEGGISLREFEPFITESEERFFVYRGTPFSRNGTIPELVKNIARIHTAPFFSVDTAKRSDGMLRLIEIGDGQVSDRKKWDVNVFCDILAKT